ncbi:hypothetical protein [Corynebacterium variabile]|uniref:hypothetical protein n=1 Tax=Corynebacterium variabile TaxID=1727 RepID=UPI002FE2E418
MDHIEWLNALTNSASAREIGRRTEVPFRTIANQINRGHLSAEVVIGVAAGYGQSPVRALVDTSFIDEQWAETVDPITALRQVSEEDLADEVLRRMKLPGAHEVFDTPVDELDARRAAKSNGRGIYPTPDVLPEDYVADSTDTEPEMGDDDYNDGP